MDELLIQDDMVISLYLMHSETFKLKQVCMSWEQEQQLSGNIGKGKYKTLKDLFKPPLDIIHKGTFETAKVTGEQEGKWLIVNIQDSKEFKCQQLNRDVWSNEAVRNIMADHFILWQVYRDSDDGDRYTQFYHVTKFPHLSVLDPRTGEKLVEWDTVDAQSFCEVATEFLMHHSLGKESNGCFSPAAKRRKRESIIDASEDSQLEAAIAASLKETSTGNNRQDKDYVDTQDEDSLTEFTDSESELEKPLKDTLEDNSVGSDRTIKTVNYEENNSKQNEKRIDDICSTENEKQENTNYIDRKNDDIEGKKFKGDDVDEDDAPDSGCVKAYIMLRYPNGKRKLKTFSAEAAILDLMKYVQDQGFSSERYELVTNFPRKKLSYMNSGLSLKDAGLFPRETVFIQERLHESSS
ncbi:UBX domain-containing protein 7-like isoform X2 [Dendronephthya gigantea]|uniref:UBX domain-containing protein 7-like isoform X2 n=1 Tax=Dendronephthya gigantea TaxID=151771 RepID=UPI0010691420|nr:UBX domain-containing protein 7-like isoform X2 [Dendronephthya gigantea]